jgi:hypothetical protein
LALRAAAVVLAVGSNAVQGNLVSLGTVNEGLSAEGIRGFSLGPSKPGKCLRIPPVRSPPAFQGKAKLTEAEMNTMLIVAAENALHGGCSEAGEKRRLWNQGNRCILCSCRFLFRPLAYLIHHGQVCSMIRVKKGTPRM